MKKIKKIEIPETNDDEQMTKTGTLSKKRLSKEPDYRALFHEIPIGFFRTTVDGELLEVNSYLAKLLGYDSIEEVMSSITDITSIYIYPDVRAKMIDDLKKKNTPVEIECHLRKKDGNRFIARIVANIESKADNTANELIGYINDITEHKMAESALKWSEERWKFALESSGDGIWDWDVNNNFIYRSARCYEMLGYSDTEISATPQGIVDLLHQDDKDRIVNENQKIICGEISAFNHIFRLKCKDGSLIWVMDRGKIIEWENDKPARIIGTQTDITNQKNIEEALRESEKKYRLLAENTTDVIWTRDINLNTTYMSPSVYKQLGYTVAEYLSLSDDERLPESSQAIVKKVFYEAYQKLLKGEINETNNLFTFEMAHRHKNGYEIAGEINFSFMFDEYRKPIGILGVTRNISERKNSENLLKKVLLEQQTILDSIPALVLFKDDKNRIIRVNKAVCDFLNITASQIEGLTSWDIFPKENADKFFLDDMEVINSGNTKSGIIEKIKIHDGSQKWVKTDRIPYRDISGKIIGVIAYIVDITQNKLSEDALIESEHKFRTLTTSAQDAIIMLNEKGTIIFWNPAAERIFGYKFTEIQNKLFQKIIVHEVKGIDIEKELYELKKTGKNALVDRIFELEAKDKHNRVFPVEASLSSVRMKGEWNAIAIVRDISERKKAEKVINNRLALEEIVSTVSNYFLKTTSKDFDTEVEHALGKIGEFSGADYAFCSMIVHNDYKIMNHLDWFREDIDANLIKSRINNFSFGDFSWCISQLKTGKMLCLNEIGNIPIEAVFEREQLKRYGVKSLLAVPLVIDDIMTGIFGVVLFEEPRHWLNEEKKLLELVSNVFVNAIMRNNAEEELIMLISELRKTKETIEAQLNELNILNMELAESESNLKELNASKDRFFSIIAHDLKGPFTGFIGLTEILSRDFESLSMTEIQKMTMNLYSSSKSLFEMLENLLTWSRIQTGKISFIPDNNDIGFVVDNTISILQVNALKKHISLISKVPKNTYSYCDIQMVSSVLNNLISNALKFTSEGGEIIVSLDVLNKEFYRINVIDNGIGIPESAIGKLFKIDQHYSTIGTSNEKGTGLGLILCKEFIEKNGGKISVESNSNRGTTFSFTLPISK